MDYPLIKSQKNIYVRQKAPKIYRINGALYTIKRDVIMKKETFFTSKTKTIIMPTEYSVDIDSPTDLLFAETLIKGKIVSFS